MISVVVPFHQGDRELAIELLRWMRELDGQQDTLCLLVADYKVTTSQFYQVFQEAQKAFKTVRNTTTPSSLKNEEWPIGPNWMFLTAAKEVMEHQYGPFLWLEPDCVPMKAGWLKQIDSEYVQCNKPYMGGKITQKDGTDNLAGVAVYPGDAYLAFDGIPMNVPWDVSRPKVITPLSHYSNQFYFFYGTRALSPTFQRTPPKQSTNTLFLNSIPKATTLYHRCKDGSLIKLLRGDLLKAMPHPSFTIVITSFKRTDMLLEAYNSCKTAGIKNIIITATGIDDKMSAFYDSMEKEDQSLKILRHGNDITANQSWFIGVEHSDTEYVALLHDDDLVLPGYMDAVAEGISRNADFIVVDATIHGNDGKQFNGAISGKDGILNSRIIEDRVLKPGTLSLSPIRGIFKRSDLAGWLRFAEGISDFGLYRPDFLVGNDLIVWMKACDTYNQFYNSPKAGVSYGHHAESTTVKDLKESRRLVGIYDRTRQWYQQQKAKPSPAATVLIKSRDVLSLKNVTLVGIDNFRPVRTVRAMRLAAKLAEFHDSVIVTSKQFQNHLSGIRVIPAITEGSRVSRERFMITRITEAFSTSHCLHMEWDSCIANPHAWDNSWLEYDFIGAPWKYPHIFHGKYRVTPDRCVGNTGFSLISKKLADALTRIPAPTDEEATVSDVFLSIGLRPELENMGIRFAPESVALKFSCECRPYTGQFGWHGRITAAMNRFDIP